MPINPEAKRFAQTVHELASRPAPDLIGESRLISHRFERAGDDFRVVRIIIDGEGKSETTEQLEEWSQGVYDTMPPPRLPRNLKNSAFGELRRLVRRSVMLEEDPSWLDAF